MGKQCYGGVVGTSMKARELAVSQEDGWVHRDLHSQAWLSAIERARTPLPWYVPGICQARTFRYSGMPLCGVREPTEHQQSTARPWLSDAEQRPPCACGVGVRYGANRLIREGLGVGNRCFVMLH